MKNIAPHYSQNKLHCKLMELVGNYKPLRTGGLQKKKTLTINEYYVKSDYRCGEKKKKKKKLGRE